MVRKEIGEQVQGRLTADSIPEQVCSDSDDDDPIAVPRSHLSDLDPVSHGPDSAMPNGRTPEPGRSSKIHLLARRRVTPYRLDPKPIGSGGYASVWRGRHRETDRVAAIKRPRRRDAEALARFRREVEVQLDLDHPNVMPIIEHSIEDEWVAMPLALHSLTRRVEQQGAIDGYQLTSVIRGLAEGLAYAHRRGYAHRDVNPNNVLEIEDGDQRRWVIADWGLVYRKPRRGSPRLTRRHVPMGTEGFTAPEAEADPTYSDTDCDVFSLGRLAHYALTSVWPRDSFPMPPPGWLWHDFVTSCTRKHGERPGSMATPLRLLTTINNRIRMMQDEAEGLICPRCEAPMTGARCERCGTVWD